MIEVALVRQVKGVLIAGPYRATCKTRPHWKHGSDSDDEYNYLQVLTMVLSSFSDALRSFVHTLVTMANPPPRPPPNSFLTPKQDINIDATSWGFLVLQPGPFHELSSSSSIVKLLYLKGKGDKEHEQLVFEVKLDPDYRHPNIFVTTDRCPKTFESQPSTPLPSLESKRTDPVPVSVSSDSLSGPFKTSSGKARADDRVFIKGSHRGFQSTEAFIDSVSGSYDVIGQWGFETPIPLSHAAIAMACVTGHSLYYEPLNHQCYWYADNVLSLLLKQRPSACKDEYFRAKQGKYLGINIRQRDSLPALTQEYGEKWESYKKDGKLFMEEETRKLDEV